MNSSTEYSTFLSIFKEVSSIEFTFALFKVIHMEKNGIAAYAKYSAVALQMGATIFVFTYLGKWLDSIYPMNKKWFTILFTLIGVSISLFNILRQVNKMNDNDSIKKQK